MIRLLFTLAVLFMGIGAAIAQSGELSGRVTDEKGEGVPFATVAVEKGGQLITGAQTDFDGYYTIKPLNAGEYDVRVSVIGYATSLTQGVRISADKITTLDKGIKVESQLIGAVEITEYRTPLIDKDEPSSKNTITRDEIAFLPTRDVQSIASTSAGVYQADEGDGVSMRGARESGTEYYIDGIRVTGSTNLPPQSIEQMTVITGGLPAKFGDATGGVISIITRGPSNTFSGGIEAITSQGMDAVGYNDLNFNLTGPIWKKYRGTDSADAKIGFFLAGEYLYEKDPDPSAIGVYKVKDEKFAELENRPLVSSPVSNSFVLASESLTMNDLEKIKSKQNVKSHTASGSLKLDYKATENISVTLGGTMNYNQYHDYIDRYVLLNTVNNPLYKELSWRTFARLTQKFGKSSADPSATTKSAFQNAYYTLQFDYSKVYDTYEDDSHGFNAFDYGYVGKFDLYRNPTYSYVERDNSVLPDTNRYITAYVRGLDSVYLVNYTPSDINPTSNNFMQTYYQLAGGDTANFYGSLAQIEGNNGLLNGQRTTEVSGIWYNTGRQFNGYGVTNDDDQFRVSLQGSVDIAKPGASGRNKHSLEFGFEFEQRIERGYSLQPIGLWELMRQETNFHLSNLDKSNPTVLINGVEYAWNDPSIPAISENDTVLYTRFYNPSAQTYFDKKLREKLGLSIDNTDLLNVDGMDPSTFDLNMFSADELLNAGNPYVNYFGYSHTGERLKGDPSFNDFFTEKDDEGNHTRRIGAFKPIYSSAYIQDKFNFKDLLFNVGVRIDRYDANQKVLADPYSLYKILTVDEVTGNASGVIPGNIGSDYAVYVDEEVRSGSNGNPPNIVGFRNGDIWYNAQGVEVLNADVIAKASSSGQITPLLDKNVVNNIKDENYDPNTSFTDYNPQITVMPRVSFSFNLTDEALFFAHYDILTQRPSGRNQINPINYYYFENNIGGAITNPDLKPERTIDYEVGFRQRISNNSAVTFSAFYRELKDNIQLTNVSFAYPRNYLTWRNIDFGTVKGFSFQFDMRKSKTSNFSAKVNYTIQFAEGTGSDDISQSNIVQAGQPNLRTIAPLDYDARHTFNVVADYRFGEGKDYNGPKIKGKDFLSNSGVNFILRGRSGTPYTQQQNATNEASNSAAGRPILEGSKNGSRLPWNFKVDMRVDKSFNISGKKKPEGQQGRDYYLNVYLLIQNLFDTRNIVSVYPYTGNPDDDGYLASPEGQQNVNNQIYPQSYTDLYNAWINNPNNYSLPRQIRLGLQFEF